jgi:DNA-binding IclR family transcriptional regulator
VARPGGWLAKATDRAGMESVLDEVRARGWAASFEPDRYQPLGSMDPAASYNVVMITAPVFGPTGAAVVAVTLLGLPSAFSADRTASYGQQVRDAGQVATRKSGGRAPNSP